MNGIISAIDSIGDWFGLFINNFIRLFSSVASFFSSVGQTIVNIGGRIWSFLEFAGYGVKTALSFMWKIIDHLFSLSFWADLYGVFNTLSVFLGIDMIYVVFMVFVIVLLIVFTFLFRLIFGKLNFLNKDKG